MRILQVSPFYPPHIGGIEFHVEALSRKLVEAGHQIVLYTSNAPGVGRTGVLEGVEVRRFSSWLSPLNNPLMPGMLLELIKSERFDVIHAHGYLHLSTNFVALRRLLGGRPLVITSHGAVLGYRGWKGIMEAAYHRTLGRWTLKQADGLIALTSTQAEILTRLGANPGRVSVVPLWIDTGRLQAQGDGMAFRRSHSLGDKQIVLFVGGLQPRKGLRYLIEAAKEIDKRAVIVIVGEEQPTYRGSRRSLEDQVKKLALEDRVLFLGGMPRDALGSVYSAADVFVLPSLAEGLPTVLLEAMAHGICVVASNIAGNRDLVQDGANGMLVEPGSPEALGRVVNSLLNDDNLRARLGTRARHDVEQRYSAGPVLAQILEVYQNAIEVRAGRIKSLNQAS